MKENLLALMFNISLKVRILRAWQAAHASGTAKFDERQMLALEILATFGDQTEATLANTLGFASSSATELTKRLIEEGVVRKKDHAKDQRAKLIELTAKGQEVLAGIKNVSGQRFEYLFAEIGDERLTHLEGILKDVLDAAEKRLRMDVFNQYK